MQHQKTTIIDMIWKFPMTVESLNAFGKVNMMKHLDIDVTELGDDYIVARMPVDHRTQQPMGILHGGASVVLAETLGSVAAAVTLDLKEEYCVGLEINANHLRSVKSGYVYGKATPIHLGKSTQVWEIKIRDEQERMVCISRITMAILKVKKEVND